MKHAKKLLSCLLALCMAMSLLPAPAQALESTFGTYTDKNGNVLKYGYTYVDATYQITGYTDSLTAVEIPSEINGVPVTRIAKQAFQNSTMTSVTIPSTITRIEDSAFTRCSSLTNVVIPSSVTHIGEFVFAYCSSLTNIELPSSLTQISSYAFTGCDALTSVIIPNGVAIICTSAFLHCNSLTSVTIPVSVVDIQNNAFDQTKVEAVYYAGTASQWIKVATASPTSGLSSTPIHCSDHMVNVFYKITLNSNGGGSFANPGQSLNLSSSQAPSASFLAADGDTYASILEQTITREGYTFDGWYTAAAGGTRITNSSTKITSDMTLYAHWTANTYTVAFDPGSGTVSPASMTVTYGQPFGDLPVPVYESYKFTGWTLVSSASSPLNNTKVTSETVVKLTDNSWTLKAGWTKDCVVTYDPNGGTTRVTSQTVTYGNRYGTMYNPTRTGYTFDGWYTALNGGVKVSASDQVTDDHTLYAHWTAQTYTIAFNANGGSVSTSSKTVNYDDPYGDLPTPVRAGYTFAGWYTSSIGNGNEITSETTVKLIQNQTLFAQWTQGTAQSYMVTFNANGGSVSTSSKSVITGQAYGDLPTPVRAGCTFTGWYTASIDGTRITSSSTVSLTANQTLYAQWINEAANTYTVTFNANGGGTVSPASKLVTADGTYGDLPVPVRDGYTFAGWFTSGSGGSQVTASTAVNLTGNQILYAHWTQNAPNSYTVTFNANGGTVNTSSKSVASGSTYGTLPTPTRTGHTFAGWFTAVEGGTQITAASKAALTAEQTLYAHWLAKTYTVTLNANGGSVSQASKTVTYGDTYGSLPTPARDSYVFGGWYTAAGGGTQVTSDTMVDLTDAQTLYAQWTEGVTQTYTVILNANGGSVSTPSKTVTAGQPYGDLPAPTRPGYIFDGWYTASTGGTQITSAAIANLTADQTLYACWIEEAAQTYAVTLNANGGTVNTTKRTVIYGSTYGDLPAPTRDGYTFTGWYTASTGGNLITSTTTVELTADQTLYAHWEAEQNASSGNYTLSNFVDVQSDAYYADAVDWIVANGITNGTGNNKFSPDSPCTRGQIVTFLWRAMGSPKVSSSSTFTDVKPDAYYADAVSWAVANGITTGTGNGKFSPDTTCTRAQAMTFLHRAEGEPSAAGSSFTDVQSGAYYADAVSWAVANNITNGTGNGKFSPDTTCTRGQIVTFLFRDLA